MKSIWEPKRRIELAYKRSLTKVTKALEKKLSGLIDLQSILKALKQFAKSKKFNEYCESSALTMVTHVFNDAGKTWREAAKKNGKGKEIYSVLKKELNTSIGDKVKEEIERNAELIKSMPLNISKEITKHVASQTIEGRRPESIMEDLQKLYPSMLESKAKLIARTECSKTSTALTKARSESIGINWYEWNSSEDSRVRSSHSNMDSVLINWDNPPSPEKLKGIKSTLGKYHAGCCPNCRCFASPVVRVSFLTWPHKVYYKGTIQTMTKKQFENIM